MCPSRNRLRYWAAVTGSLRLGARRASADQPTQRAEHRGLFVDQRHVRRYEVPLFGVDVAWVRAFCPSGNSGARLLRKRPIAAGELITRSRNLGPPNLFSYFLVYGKTMRFREICFFISSLKVLFLMRSLLLGGNPLVRG